MVIYVAIAHERMGCGFLQIEHLFEPYWLDCDDLVFEGLRVIAVSKERIPLLRSEPVPHESQNPGNVRPRHAHLEQFVLGTIRTLLPTNGRVVEDARLGLRAEIDRGPDPEVDEQLLDVVSQVAR